MLKGFFLSILIGPVVPEPAPAFVVEALTSAQVTTSAGSRSGFQLSFAAGKNSKIISSLLPAGYFDPPTRVILVITLNGTPNVIMDGVITRHEVTPGNQPGQSTLVITGEDLSRMMDLIDFSGFPFPAMPAEVRVALMVAKYAFYGIVPLVIPSVLIDIPNPLLTIPSQEGTDLQYINQLAGEVGYVFYVEAGPAIGMNTAYWGPEIKFGVPQPALAVNMDAHTNVESLSFSFDGFASTLYLLYIQEPFTKLNLPIPIPDVTPLNPPLGRKLPLPLRIEQIKEKTSKYNPIQAAAIGLAKVAKASEAISGSGRLDVLRYGRILKARQLVGVRGAGQTYDGLYYVRSVTHNLKPGEYKQSFTLSRNALISNTERLPV